MVLHNRCEVYYMKTDCMSWILLGFSSKKINKPQYGECLNLIYVNSSLSHFTALQFSIYDHIYDIFCIGSDYIMLINYAK